MLYKIVPEKCIACGLCQVLAPAVFDYTDDGIVIFKDAPTLREQFLTNDLAAEGMAAYKQCPTRAIEIVK